MEKSYKCSLAAPIENSVLCLNSVGMHRIVYSDWGQNNEHIIICIHGLTGNGHDFDFLAQSLINKNFRVIAIDLAGRGRSDFLSNPIDYNYHQYCQDIMVVLAHLNIQNAQSIDWLGVSLGGLLGIRLAGLQNTPVRRLIINDVGPEVPKTALNFIYSVIKKTYKFANLEAFEKRLRETRGLTWGPVTDEQWKHMAESNFREIENGEITYAYDEKIAMVFKNEPTGGNLDLWSHWKNITCPVLVLRGKESEVLPENTLNKMKEGATMSTIDTHNFQGCGHVPSLMSPEQISVISNWLETRKP